MYQCIIFDMDGTLVDSYEGIYRAYEWTMKKMNLEFEKAPFVREAIGMPLPLVFRELCGLDGSETGQAVTYYRAWYDANGKQLTRLYEGMKESLRRLKNSGCMLGVATMKKERFALEILRQHEILEYFDAVCGADEADCLTKAELVEKCRRMLGADREETLLVGDSKYDAEGARDAGVGFLAVTYGFGFGSDDALKEAGVRMRAGTPEEMAEKILVL